MQWTLAGAVLFLQELQTIVAPAGYHVGLLGSVLTKGFSDKDLDVLLYPHRTSEQNHEVLRQALVKAGLEPWLSDYEVKEKWRGKDSDDTKHVEVWLYKGQRVDFFLLA
jgi:hypothetical protein